MRLLKMLDRLRTSFWFLPSTLASAAVVLSFLMIELDSWIGGAEIGSLSGIYKFGPEGARAVLSAIASSMITVAGLTFSITMLTLQLASSQFGPRLLRNFLRDRGNQLVLGAFLASFLYCLLVLRTIRGVEGASFVPHLSVAVGVLLAVMNIAVLIYFIHHVATSIRIETLLVSLAEETRSAIDRLYPETLGHEASPDGQERPLPADFCDRARSLHLDKSGYIQALDADTLMRIACEENLIVRVDARPGRFVTERDTIFSVYPAPKVGDDVADRLRATVIVGTDRTAFQDLGFSIRRLVEIAQRALSPGINDPTTAMYCIDRLGEALGRLALRTIPSPVRCDDDGNLRVVTEVSTLEDLACPAFAAIARYAFADADVIARLLFEMSRLSELAQPAACAKLVTLRGAIADESMGQLRLHYDRQSVRAAS